MRRTAFTVGASILALGLAPAPALAKHHHKRHHRARVVHRLFGTVSSSPTTTTTTTTPTSSDTAGTVANFTPASGSTPAMLTIKLNGTNGASITGAVTNATEIRCESTSTTIQTDDDHPGDGDHNGSDSSGSGDNGSSSSGDDNGQEQEGQDNDDQAENQNCTPTNGMVVVGAELKISSAGEVWEKLDLIS